MPGIDVIAIVFAGGVGSRMRNAEQPKQFMPVAGKPILVHTLEHFQHHADVRAIYISCLESHIDRAWQMVRHFGVDKVQRILQGGASAQESIYNAVCSAVDDGVPPDAVTLVHDGVRPVINRQLISLNISSTRQHGSGITAIPCFETIARSTDGAETVDFVTLREQMHVLQAPQTFELAAIRRLNERSIEEGLLGSFVDQAHLMNHYGEELHMVPGFRGNVKITTDFDLLQFQVLADSGHLSAVVGEFSRG